MADLPGKDSVNKARPLLIAILVGISLFFSAFFFLTREASSDKFDTGTHVIKAPGNSDLRDGGPVMPVNPVEQKPRVSRYDFRLSGSNTFYQIMSVLNVPGAESEEIRKKARPIYDLKQLRKDTVLRVFTLDDKLDKIEYTFSDFETLLIEREKDDSFKVSKSELAHEVRESLVSGTIENSLYEDGIKAGADPQAIMALSDIFAWDVDFASDIKKGDSFNILAEVLYVDGVPVRTGRVLGAEMVNEGKKYTAFYFRGADGDGYYDADGKSLRRTLLKSPLRFRRITSYFSKGRFHPILKKYRPHHGIDYGAPVGTPIESAGSGRVAYAGWKGGYGNFVEIRHNNNYSTAYGHLSRINKGIKTGAKVDQGAVIGYVGSTGISTGPHLHYEVKLSGKLINPLSIKAVSDASVTKKDRLKFASFREGMEKKLSGKQTVTAASGAAPAAQVKQVSTKN
ncbi:MAG: peptidoglycan DD-metalloendopeptidase family protein [Deltaproteobacteria bacterium]|nr:peptidoglycan DD-metalloendopeptidase family protein [Deltaproteobacteria bacterium]